MSAQIPATPLRSPGKADIIRAIILRETRVRFGLKRLGYLWALIEPLLHILSLSVIFLLLARVSPVEEGMPVFFATGVLPWLLFANTISQVMHAPDANRALLIYPHIYPLDFMVGRIILESVTYLLVAVLLLIVSWLVGAPVTVKDPLQCLAAWASLSVMAGGLGMICAALYTYFHSFGNLYSTVLRILYFLSGIFYLMNDMPPDVRDALSWNPLLHAIEWIRSSTLMSYSSDYASPAYVVGCAACLLLGGMIAERMARLEMRTP